VALVSYRDLGIEPVLDV